MKIIAFSFIIINLIKQYLNYIVYPLNTFPKSDKFENLLSFNSTYTTIEMGTPHQKVDFYFNLEHNKIYVTDIGCQKTNLYNFNNKSKTLYILGDMEKGNQRDNRVLFMETLYFYDNINLSEVYQLDEYPLYYLSEFNENNFEYGLCGNIGLSITQYEANNLDPDEYEYYIKYIRTQNNYFSFFHYNDTDFIINGIFLHQEFNDMFTEIKNISWVNPIIRENSLNWEISMKEVYYNNIHFKNKVTFELNPLFELIIGTNDYKNNIQKDFFDFYINKKICSMNEMKGYSIFECDPDKFGINDIKKFPTLFMYNLDINHIFEMNGTELFLKLNNKYYFKVVFSVESQEIYKWTIGKIFFRKYPTIFSSTNRLIGFYIKPNEGIVNDNQNIEREEDSESGPADSSIYIKILIIALIFTGLGLYIGKRLFFQRRKKANELTDDYYEYDSGDNKDIKKVDKNNKSTSIEMNSKIDKN